MRNRDLPKLKAHLENGQEVVMWRSSKETPEYHIFSLVVEGNFLYFKTDKGDVNISSRFVQPDQFTIFKIKIETVPF